MPRNENKVAINGINQPTRIQLPNLDFAVAETVKNSALYKNASGVRSELVEKERLLLAAAATTNGWDTVSICRVTALNERIKAEKTYPKDMKEEMAMVSVEGDFKPWQIITGGDGRNVKLNIPIETGKYRGMSINGGEGVDISGVSVDVYVKLSYFPMPDPLTAADGTYDLYTDTGAGDAKGAAEPIAAVIALHAPEGLLDEINKSILRGLFESWLNKPENLKKFDTLFSTVLINNMGKGSEEYAWLRATSISYAYTDKNTEESSIFGILCMTNNRSHAGLPNQLPAVSLLQDDNAMFLISREVFVQYQFLPSLPFVFTDSPEATYEVDEAGTTVTGKNIQLDPVHVGAIDYYPIAESFEVTFDEAYIRTTAKIHTPISPGIDAHTVIITKQTLNLDENSQHEQVMAYEMVGNPIVENSTDIAAWIVVTEALLALVAAVVTGVAGHVAGKMVALIVGIVVALVVALVSITIHVIIEKVIAGAVTDALPSIAPMVKVAANQVKWPFAEPDAFVLSDIDYSGSIIFEGRLVLRSGYSVVDGRLVYAATA